MAEFGDASGSGGDPRRVWVGALLAVGAALVPMLWLFGFTVDDALITARVAHQLAAGHGYAFNPNGPSVDAVTPLGYAYVLAPAAATGPLSALVFAKWLGAGAWLAAAGFVGSELSRAGRLALGTGIAALLVCTPLAAWAVSGMETAVVTLLATLALGRSRFSALAAGLAAGLRPELGLWAFVLTFGRAAFEPLNGAGSARARALVVARSLSLGLGPLLLVAVVRTLAFGHAYPLSALAKPSDLPHGAIYAVSAWLHTGPPWLVLAALATYRGLSIRSRVAVVAAVAHFLALLLVGGDWMPLYRLVVPVLPGLILAGGELNQRSGPGWASALRLLAALAVALNLAWSLGPSAARVGSQRAALIDGARPVLAGAQRVGTLDVGWVGAATGATIVDFAGVTDPTVARLGGGHTSKRLPPNFLESRAVDALVVLAERPRLVPLAELAVMRGVEARLAALDGASNFRPLRIVPLLGTNQGYVIYRRAPSSG
jgi:hypothetical protein